jgi:hypothetical protein
LIYSHRKKSTYNFDLEPQKKTIEYKRTRLGLGLSCSRI